MGTLLLLETLLRVINSLSVARPPNQQVVPPQNGTPGPAPVTQEDPATIMGAQTDDAAQPDPAYAQQQPEIPAVPPQQTEPRPPQTEESLREQLGQVDLYDLSGEKAAAEALRRDDEFKQQQIDAKAEQTKEFFAEQDRKQQETLAEVQAQTEQRLEETRQKEFWDAKQSQEMQAGMEKELRSLHESARQEHEQWRAGFTEGICRDDATAVINNQIEDRVGAYKDRLDDLGTNPVDAAETVDKYKVKLEGESSGQIDQRTAELHQEHFPEYQGIAKTEPAGPEKTGPEPLGEIPQKGFGPFEAGPQGGYGLDELVNKNADFGPWEQVSAHEPDKPFMRGMYDPRGDGTDAPEGWFKDVDKIAKENTEAWMKNIDAIPEGAKENTDAWMKPIGPPSAAELAAAAGAAAGASAEFIKETAKNPEAVHAALEYADHEMHVGAIPGVPHDIAQQTGESVKTALEYGPGYLEAAAPRALEEMKAKLDSLQNQAQEAWGAIKQQSKESWGDAKQQAQEALDGMKQQAQETLGEVKEIAQATKENLTISSNEKIDQMVQESANQPETEQNKVLKEVFTQDNPPDPNANLLEMYKQRQHDLGKSSTEIESASASFNAHAHKVDQAMQPPIPTPTLTPTPTPTPVEASTSAPTPTPVETPTPPPMPTPTPTAAPTPTPTPQPTPTPTPAPSMNL